MTWHLDLTKEAASITSNIKDSAQTALHGPVGILSNPGRFLFYSTLLGATTLLLLQVIDKSLHSAMEDD